MKPILISSMNNITNLTEIRVRSMEDISEIAELLKKPILDAKDFARKDQHNMVITKQHSFLAVIDGNIIYKYVYNIKEDEP